MWILGTCWTIWPGSRNPGHFALYGGDHPSPQVHVRRAAAARVKPVMVLKGGRHPEASRASRCHTGRPAGADAVYHAAFRRAGMLRVDDIQELFDAVETLATTRQVSGKRLAILTNGGGIGVLAADALMDAAGVSPHCLPTPSRDSTPCCRLPGPMAIPWTSGRCSRLPLCRRPGSAAGR